MQLHRQTVSAAGGVTGATETLTAPPRRPAEEKLPRQLKQATPRPEV